MNFFRAFLTLMVLCGTSFGEAYICNIDYFEDITKNPEDRGLTAILISGFKASYIETLGSFKIKIISQDQIKITVNDGYHIISDYIEHQDSSKRFFRSYVKGRSGLRISCQKRSLGKIDFEF